MNVRELIEELRTLNPESQVMVSTDAEGNDTNPLHYVTVAWLDSDGCLFPYGPDTPDEEIDTDAGFTREFDVATEESDEVVIIFPS